MSLTHDIRRFEQIGTHLAAMHNAIAEALVFHRGIGVARRAARIVYTTLDEVDTFATVMEELAPRLT